MTDLQDDLDQYRRDVESFRADIPDEFNFGRDVLDRYAEDPKRPALLWRSEDGAERRLSFADVRDASNRVASLFRSLGIGRGDPVIVMLPRVPEWQITISGALKSAALVIPSSTILRPKDVVFRAAHSGAVAIIAAAAQAREIDAIRSEIPGVAHFLVLCEEGVSPPDGWIDLRSALEIGELGAVELLVY